MRRIPITVRKWRAEFETINQVLAGDFSRSGAFIRHKRALPASLYFRLACLVPAKRRVMDDWYRSRGVENPLRPFRESILNRLSAWRNKAGV